MPRDERHTQTIPYGTLGIVPLASCSELGKKVNNYLVDWREQRDHEDESTLAFSGYKRDSYIVSASTPRFGSGEGKGVLNDSVRGYDLYIMVDVCNYSLEYSLCGYKNHMSPDDHYADLKRVIAAAGGKARRITVIMPFLYESRQHKRSGRESLDCALALKELTDMGVDNIITFDAHDPRVQNAIPLKGFESVSATYQFIKYLLLGVDDLHIDSDHMMVISPDEGGMGRAVYFANVLGLDMGMFYKRRDYTKIVNGRNPIVAHEFLGSNVEGKDVVIIDDMISSGESMIDVAAELKREQENNSRTIDVDDRAVAQGDMVTLDFEGFVDGVAFEGGKGTDYPLTIGSNSFIPGFEDQLIGANIDEEKEINVTFPEEYQAKELAGKAAVFKCTVHSIKAKELPELDDEFVSDVSEKSETVDAYKAEVKAKIKERKENEGKQKREDQSVEQAVANAEMDIPEAMISFQSRQMVDDFARRIMQQGMTMEQYFQFTGLSEEKMMEEFKPEAEKRIRTRLTLEAIVAAENIEVSEERLDEELQKMADSYKMEVDKLKEYMGENEKKQMKEDIAIQEAVTLIANAAVEG